MAKAFIFNSTLSAAEREMIEEAIQLAGYTLSYGVPSDISTVEPSTDIGVVGLPTAIGDLVAVDAGMQAFAGKGIRVVCVWLRDDEGTGMGVPQGVGKYGTKVDIGSPALVDALKGVTEVWEDPGGAPSPIPKTKRNKC